MFGMHRPRAARLRGVVAVALASFLLMQFTLPPTRTALADTGGDTILLNGPNATATEDFNTLANTAGTTHTTLPLGWYITETGGSARDNEAYSVGTGSATDGDTYSFGPSGNTDRALGELTTGTLQSTFGAQFTNGTGKTINSLFISYTGEQWRVGGNHTTIAERLNFSYSTDAGSLTGGTYTDFDALDFTPLITTGATASLDGNNSANRKIVSGAITGLSIPNGATFWVRWQGVDATSGDDGLAVDDFSVAAGTPFSDDGMLTDDVSAAVSSPELDDAAFSVAIQSTGRIVAGGYVEQFGEPSHKDFTLSRYNQDGTTDATFTSPSTNFGANPDDRIYGIALEADDDIVAAGSSHAHGAGSSDAVVALYGANGGAHTGSAIFSTANDAGSVDEEFYAVAIQPSDGKIVAVGTTNANGLYDFLIVRYDALLNLDTTFGDGDGVVTIDFNTASTVEAARAVAIDSGGNIVVAGYTHSGTNFDFAVARLLGADGSPDPTFAGDGTIVTDFFSRSDQAFGLALQADGKIVVGGSSVVDATPNKDFALARYETDGDLDATFDTDGLQTTDFFGEADIIRSVVVQPDQKIAAAGQARIQRDHFALARYDTGGSLDTTFSADGMVTTPFAHDKEDRAYGLALQDDGKLVAAGYAENPSSPFPVRDFALARYLPDGSPDADVGAAPARKPDIVLTIDNLPNQVIGTNFTYRMTVTNKGPGAGTNVTLTDVMPAEVAGLSYLIAGGPASCFGSSAIAICDFGTLHPGQSTYVDITVVGHVARLVTNTASVTSNEGDFNNANNTASETSRILGVSAVNLSPTTVVGGCQNPVGTVTLSGPAPAGGLNVTLTSANPAATVPATVFVPAGSTVSDQFTVTTSSVGSTTAGQINARLGTPTASSSVGKKLTVTPGACI
ncbi:MAG TPA: hypothetical protein VD968_13005 [Pyrinomonadaceae bacterium]|nr:hypothetical protein [Pyrinomonadaceae bacterium]